MKVFVRFVILTYFWPLIVSLFVHAAYTRLCAHVFQLSFTANVVVKSIWLCMYENCVNSSILYEFSHLCLTT